MCLVVVSRSDGAYLPSVSAPPAPLMLWHWAQLVRNSTPPLDTESRSLGSESYAPASGMSGPAPREATYAAMASISPWLKARGLAGACGPICWAGMRPVPTWKSTAAPPTPTSDGPEPWMPCPCVPWQDEQEDRKSFWPSESCSGVAPVEADAFALAEPRVA